MAEGRHQHTLPNGYQFEGYRIDGVLGAGGFGITYKATEVAIDRPVAIKEFLPGGIVMRDPDRVSVRPVGPKEAEEFAYGLSRFRQEAQTLVRFRHPNIVTLHRYLEAHGTAYLVMNFEDGESLGNILRREHTLTESELREILDPILDGLKEVHEAGFLHRDIKPDNIYVRRDGSPVLLDFGAARQALGERSQSLTSIFTSGYAPLEQYSTRGGHGPWTDIYGLAASVYRAMTGIKPPPAPDRIRNDPYRPAREAAKGRFSPQFLAAIDRALALHPEDRPQSVEAFRKALGGPALHRHRTAAWPRSRLPWAAAALIVLAGTGGAAYYIADHRASSPNIAATAKRLATEQRNAKATRLEQEEAQRRAAAERKQLEEAAARERADAEAKRKAEEDARRQAKAAAKRKAEEDARRQAEAAAKRKAEEDARRQAEAAAKRKAEEDARRQAEAAAKRKAEEDARRQAEAAANRKAEEDARRQAEAAAKRKAEEDARRQAEAAAKRKAEEDARRQAEAAAKRKAEEDARRQAEAAAKRKAEEDARRQAEAAAKRQAEAEAKRKVEAQARERAAAERARREKEARARKVAGGLPSPTATSPQLARRTPGPTVAASNPFTGRTAFFARLSTAKQATLRIRIAFRADGGLEAQCLAEAPDGKTAPCEPTAGTAGPGRWSFVDKQLCLSAAVLGLNGRHCYAISGAGAQYTAAGSGVLAGSFMLR